MPIPDQSNRPHENEPTDKTLSLSKARINTIFSTVSAVDIIKKSFLTIGITHPTGFLALPDLHSSQKASTIYSIISHTVDTLLNQGNFTKPSPLDILNPESAHAKYIYKGVDYYDKGPVIVNPTHLAKIFPNFAKPSEEEVAIRVQVNKDYFGTMPGVESAYTAAIVKAIEPRTMFMIGEHRGALSNYLAQTAPEECLIFCMDLPSSMSSLPNVMPLDDINKTYMTYEENQLGQIWRDSKQEYSKRIIGLLGDSTHEHSAGLFNALKGKIDLIIVDGNHAYDAVFKDLQTAAKLVSPGGVIILDDFWKPARLFEVTRAALNFQQSEEGLRHLYHLSWKAGEASDQIDSNLAFFIAK